MSLQVVTAQSGRDATHFISSPARRPAEDLLLCRHRISDQQRTNLESLAYRYASVPESYDIAVSDGHVLQSPCGKGAMSVLVDGKFWHVSGSLLAPEPLKPDMIRMLRQISECSRKTIAVYNVSQTDALSFQRQGFVVNKFGEEAVLTPSRINWKGGQYEWVRRQTNYCRRAGLDVAEVTDRDEQCAMAQTLVSIMSEDLAGRTFDKPLRLLEGEFRPGDLQRRRLFVARSADGRVEAFLACSPIDGGRSWAFETYRKRNRATRGVTAFLFRTVIDQLKDEGAESISLCLIPGRNVANSEIKPGDRRIQRLMSLWYSRLDFVFNARGQDHFKSRFRPHYVSRYLCVAPCNSLTSLWSFLKTTGALNCNVRNLLKSLYRKSAGSMPPTH
ncbi:MAG: DUF2156 domain-containing protein [Planctomycetaceae bacterium]